MAVTHLLKVCTGCRVEQPITAFSRNAPSADGRHPRCKTCRSEEAARRYNADPEKARDQARWRNLKFRMGVTREEYEAMWVAQGGKCAICSAPSGSKAGHHRLVVDHDHESGQRRELLCHSCNMAVGMLGDDPDRLLLAAAYLIRHGRATSAPTRRAEPSQ